MHQVEGKLVTRLERGYAPLGLLHLGSFLGLFLFFDQLCRAQLHLVDAALEKCGADKIPE
jgi:hypothetical protein